MMVVSPGASTAQVRAASAMKGYIADQKAVLVFHPSHTGRNVLASFDVEGKAVDLHEKLLKEGFSFHTLQPVGEGRFRVHVFASDNATINAVAKASVGFDVIPEFVRGDGEFIGTTKEDGTDREQRDDAENNTNKSSEPLQIPAHWKDKTSERLGTKFAIIGVNPKQAAGTPRASRTRIFRQRATDRQRYPYVERLQRAAGAR